MPSAQIAPVIVPAEADERGFSLVEAIVAAGLLAGALAALGQMLGIAVATHRSARAGSDATVLAQQKMEQLRGLTWGFDVTGFPITDTATDTAASVETPTGGTGLTPSPTDTLVLNASGWVDYVDQSGAALGGGTEVPAGAVYLRRWAIEPLPSNPSDTIVIRVFVRPAGRREVVPSRAHLPDEALLIGIRTRKAP
jgi:type II secretory pathway pseudopilin PulG